MRGWLFILVILISPVFLSAQDAVLSQYNSFPLYTNMAMAGSKGCSRVVMGTRLQWLNLAGGYKSTYVSYDQYSRHLHSGFGMEYFLHNESDGQMTSEYLQFTFSPSISVGKRLNDSLRAVVIKPAFNFGSVKYSINWNKFAFGDLIDPLFGYIYGTNELKNRDEVTAPDFGTGVFVYGQVFFGGIYFQHITEPEMGFLFTGSPLPLKMTLNGGYLFKGYSWLGKVELFPSFIYESANMYQGSGYTRTDITLTARYLNFLLGLGGRIGSSFIFTGGFENRNFKIGYSYDLNATRAWKAVGSTHELTLGFKFAHRKEHKKIRTLDF